MKKKIEKDVLIILVFIVLIVLFTLLNYSNVINGAIWAIATILIIIGGIYFSFKLNFIQLNFKEMFRYLKKDKNNKDGISTLESLSISLGGRVGVGSLAGVALSIYIGGSGTIFWMWVITLIGGSVSFVESALGVIYQEKIDNNINCGGPSYYIKKGLGKNNLSIIYAALIIISYIGCFLTIQANTIVHSINSITYVNPIIIVVIIGGVTSLLVFNSIKKVANFMSKLVPFMTIIYILLGLIVIISKISIVPEILYNIFKNAFTIRSVGGGVLSIIIIGIQRGVFSNEAGLGTSAISSSMTCDSPVKQGMIQVLGVYVTTLIITTITALIILTSNYQLISISDLNGIEITQYAFKYHFGNIGEIILLIVVILFAFSTIVSGYYYGEVNLKFLISKNIKSKIIIFKVITIILIMLGGIISSSFLWNIVDTFVGLLIIINIYACILLINDVVLENKIKKITKTVT